MYIEFPSKVYTKRMRKPRNVSAQISINMHINCWYEYIWHIYISWHVSILDVGRLAFLENRADRAMTCAKF